MRDRHSHLSALRNPETLDHARELRSDMTKAEMLLWYYLRARRFKGRKVRRQVPVGRYVVDFLCEEARLIIEVDGGQHQERADRDAVRTRALEELGYRVIRFWNHDVMGNTNGVLEVLDRELTLSPALSQGRGRTA